MKVSIGSDHGGIELKQALVESLKAQGVEVHDVGTQGTKSVDYPDYAVKVGKSVASAQADFGVLVCTTGIGMSISANKVKGVRAAMIFNEDSAKYSRLHNDANVICMGARYETSETVKKLVDIFIKTEFEGGRHSKRVDKIKQEEQNL